MSPHVNVDIGHFCLIGAWILSVYGAALGVFAAIRKDRRGTDSARNSVILTAAFAGLSLVALGAAFLHHDYRYLYVWRTSNNEMPWPYLISAIWGGMDGSMLLWASLGSLYGAFCLLGLSNRPVSYNLFRWIVPTIALSGTFFFTVVSFVTNPFRLIPEGANPLNGNGLNPLLQNPSMMIHPPSLYLGFTGFVIPFAFAIAALLSGESDWFPYIRRWTLIAWGFLTAGIVLGGNWAYIELGWGGFWAWDPVENASFLPWLSATALIHSVMVEERRGMLKIWNLSLAILTYLLTVFGTFLTRSGIVQSVHAFAETDMGWIFLLYLGIVLTVAISLLIYRRKELRSSNVFESYLSREGIFLFNNLILLGICFTTFWGVMFPVLSEAIIGEKSSVGPPFYNSVNGPLFLALMFFMALGPLVSWKSMRAINLWAQCKLPMAIATVVGVVSLIFEPLEIKAALAFTLSTFIFSSVVLELRKGMKARRELVQGGALDLIRSKPRRYGGLLVHLGVSVMAVAIAASSLFKIERDFVVRPGERFEIGRYALQLTELRERDLVNYQAVLANVAVFSKSGGDQIATLHPERRFYPRSEEVTSEVDIRMTLRDDLYLALSGLGTKGEAIFKAFVNPLQLWLWVGALITLSGTIFVIGPRVVTIDYALASKAREDTSTTPLQNSFGKSQLGGV